MRWWVLEPGVLSNEEDDSNFVRTCNVTDRMKLTVINIFIYDLTSSLWTPIILRKEQYFLKGK